MSDTLLLTYDERYYSVEAIQKAAYRALNSLSVDISINDGQLTCTLNPNIGLSDVAFPYAVQEFKKDVLDQHLRLKLKAETEPIRNLILGIAFSRTGLQIGE